MRAPSAKRALDLTGALLLLLLLAPLLGACAAAVAFTTPGGALCRRTRAGRGGEPFELLRFRTTRAPAAPGRARPAALHGNEGHLRTLRDDPRVTPVGRVLRRLALDDLPQLVNVVRGEMSLVGPRPLPVTDSGRTGPAPGRLGVLPGITGLWQVSGRSDLPWNEMGLLDLEYVDRHCLGLDLRILARTVPAALTARGAR